MNLNFTIIELIDFAAFTQGIILGIILMTFGRRKNIANIFLGLFIVTFSLDITADFIDIFISENKHSRTEFLPTNFYYTTFASLFLYAKSLTGNINKKIIIKNLSLGFFEFLIFLTLFLLPINIQKQIVDSDIYYAIEAIYYISYAFVFAFYAIQILREIEKHKQRVDNYFSSTEGKYLRWIKRLVYYLSAMIISMAVLLIFSVYIPESYEDGLDLFYTFCTFIFIYWVTITGYSQNIIHFDNLKIKLKQKKKTEIESEKVSETKLEKEENNDEKLDEMLFQKLSEFMNLEKPHLNSELNIGVLASDFSIPQKKLSNIINKKTQMNFNKFINNYRIEEAKKLLTDERFSHLNMLGIAFEAGFNSKATFYSVFKQLTGKTPNSFKKETI